MTHDNLTLNEILQQKSDHSQRIIEVDEKTVKVVIFRLAEDWYAFHGEHVREILPDTTPLFFVPGCPPSLVGVINVRGEIESVINIAMILNLSSANTSPPKMILLTRSTALHTGVCVNEVVDVVDIQENLIHPPPETFPDHLRANVSGVVQFYGRAVSILNLEQILIEYQQGTA